MSVVNAVRQVLAKLFRRHGDIRSFEDDVEAGGGMSGRSDAGTRTIDTRKVVGSVGRAHNLRSDFFYKKGKAMTARYHRVGAAMQEGKELPPLELIKVKRGGGEDKAASPPQSEYYVVDGHHRVAMARKLGQDFLDAHVVEVRVGSTGAPTHAQDAGASAAAVGFGGGPTGSEAATHDETLPRSADTGVGLPADAAPSAERRQPEGTTEGVSDWHTSSHAE